MRFFSGFEPCATGVDRNGRHCLCVPLVSEHAQVSIAKYPDGQQRVPEVMSSEIVIYSVGVRGEEAIAVVVTKVWNWLQGARRVID